jgi:hypothetical protein
VRQAQRGEPPVTLPTTSAPVCLENGERPPPTPRLSTAFLMTCRQCLTSCRSPGTSTAFRPSFSMSFLTSAASSVSLRKAIRTSAPSRANAIATARPRPLSPQVMTARQFARAPVAGLAVIRTGCMRRLSPASAASAQGRAAWDSRASSGSPNCRYPMMDCAFGSGSLVCTLPNTSSDAATAC